MSTNKQANRLIYEKSPYLLQHAHNPVNWFPWSDEAFQKAKSEDKPIFLSIGYSTCHWCHVMERESFEHDQVAEYLNEYFISIKVDREERPDVDHIYMQVCQMMTGQGGWPLSIFMNGEKEPFFAGTYFPRESRRGMPGFLDLLKQIQDIWENKRDKINEAAQSILLSLREEENKEDKIEDLPKSLITVTYEQLEDSFEKEYGGFGQQPKFPIPQNLLYLLRYTYQFREKQGQKMVVKTLDSMYCGGIYDHIGYGFSRYSTDSKWLVPHFEKMLYDNALLLMAYTEIYQVTQEEVYKKIANKIITYILRDMVSDEGGFYTAEDADSEGVEGKFYVWDPEKVLSVLGEERGKEFCRYYDITLKGNFEGKSIPNLIHNPHTIEEIERNKKLAEDRQKLFLDRQKRIHPHKDDKILTAWNGLMIAALSIAGKAFDKVEYMKAAEKCVSFIIDNLVSENRLLARYREGESKHKGYLEDYAFLSWGLLELFQATGNEKYLKMSQKYVHEMIDLFWDEQNGGFYLTGKDAEELLLRPKEIYDGALPSGNSVAAYVMIRLGRLLHDDQLEKKVKDLLMHFYPQISSYPMGYSFYMMAYMQYYFEKRSIILIGDFRSEGYQNLKKKLDTMYLPFTSIRYIHEKNNSTEYKMIQGEPTLYLCENYTCKEPIYGNKQIIDCLDELQLS